jgi:hypothetical protein
MLLKRPSFYRNGYIVMRRSAMRLTPWRRSRRATNLKMNSPRSCFNGAGIRI